MVVEDTSCFSRDVICIGISRSCRADHSIPGEYIGYQITRIYPSGDPVPPGLFVRLFRVKTWLTIIRQWIMIELLMVPEPEPAITDCWAQGSVPRQIIVSARTPRSTMEEIKEELGDEVPAETSDGTPLG